MRCQVWWAHLDRLDDALTGAVSAVEAKRAAGYHREADRRRSRLGAALLRHVVGRVTGVPPARVAVRRACPDCGGPHGRPSLPGTGWQVSLTHAGDWAGLALSDTAPVGLDLEPVTAAHDEATVDVICAPEEERPVDARGFLELWTAKEAVLKATGEGLACPPSQVVLRRTDRAPQLLSYRGAPRDASLRWVSPAPGYVGALAVLGPLAAVVEHRVGPVEPA